MQLINYYLYKKSTKFRSICSFYSIKTLELIMNEKSISEVKNKFLDGTFLIQLIKQMNKFILLKNEKMLISDNKDTINF